jgi:hypothetical protein
MLEQALVISAIRSLESVSPTMHIYYTIIVNECWHSSTGSTEKEYTIKIHLFDGDECIKIFSSELDFLRYVKDYLA